MEQQDADEREVRDERAADVVRDVPGRDGQSALFRAEPVHHRLAARRPAHALHPAVDRHDHDDRDQRRACRFEQAECRHDHARQQQAERQEVLRVAAVRDRAHQELRNTVRNRQSGQRGAERRLRVLRVLPQQVRESRAPGCCGRGSSPRSRRRCRRRPGGAGGDSSGSTCSGRQRLRERRGTKPSDHRAGAAERQAMPLASSTDAQQVGSVADHPVDAERRARAASRAGSLTVHGTTARPSACASCDETRIEVPVVRGPDARPARVDELRYRAAEVVDIEPAEPRRRTRPADLDGVFARLLIGQRDGRNFRRDAPHDR